MRFFITELATQLNGRVMGATAPQVAPHKADEKESADAQSRFVTDGLAIDSRLVIPGQLFAAVRADRDGHDYVDAAFAAGAAAVLVDNADCLAGSGLIEVPERGMAIVVEDVPLALMEIARIARGRLPDRVVGVTGSVGKTTTKDLLAEVLAQQFVTVASEKSFNNELGVPLTLANAPEGTEVAVVEMGARGAGHISLLCELARPTVGIVTTVERVHTEVMGGIEQIAQAKGELIEALPPTGLAVLNAEVPLVAAMAERTDAKVLRFGQGGDVQAIEVQIDEELRPSFVLLSPWGRVAVRLGVRGAHNVSNALAAATAALGLGLSLEQVAVGLESAVTSPLRMDLQQMASGALLLNDSYNAGPASMAAALRALTSLPGVRSRDAAASSGSAGSSGSAASSGSGSGRRIAVLGLMAELGDSAPKEHQAVAELADQLQIQIIAVGTDLYGVPAVEGVPQAVDALTSLSLTAGDAVLVKGSRVAGLERLAQALL
jgi:UDP-N-acetylmuramoyl-tripeptide--D-alanyl-D-alanine ligase